jgi:TRAP-type C4-dicarboxylate transport system permease small subunit
VKALRAVNRVLSRLERFAAVSLLIVTVTIVVAQVFFRYVLNSSLGWSEEGARYLFIWSAALGFSSCVEAKRLFSFDMVVSALPPPARRLCKLLFAGAAAVLLWVLIVDGTRLAAATLSQHSPAIGVPMGAAYAALPVMGVLITLHLLASIGRPAGETGIPGEETGK